MKQYRWLIIIILATPSLSFAGSFDNFNFGIGLEDYTWTEQANLAIQPKERGNRLAIFIDYANVKKDDYYFAYAGKIYGGTVDYDSCTLGTCSPTITSSDYIGMYNEVKLIAPTTYVNGIASFGFDYWTRNINNGLIQSLGISSAGYTEQYNIFYAKLGADVKIGSKVNILLGIKQTLQNNEQIINSSLPAIHPGSSTSPYLEASYIVATDMALGVYYDTYNFKGGNPNSLGYFQPASKMQAIGTKLTWLF
jgi:hypothetical protein